MGEASSIICSQNVERIAPDWQKVCAGARCGTVLWASLPNVLSIAVHTQKADWERECGREGRDEQGGIQLRPGEEEKIRHGSIFCCCRSLRLRLRQNIVAWERPIGRRAPFLPCLPSRSPGGISQRFGNCTRRTATKSPAPRTRSAPCSKEREETSWQNGNAGDIN